MKTIFNNGAHMKIHMKIQTMEEKEPSWVIQEFKHTATNIEVFMTTTFPQ